MKMGGTSSPVGRGVRVLSADGAALELFVVVRGTSLTL